MICSLHQKLELLNHEGYDAMAGHQICTGEMTLHADGLMWDLLFSDE